jgi:NTE family protein
MEITLALGGGGVKGFAHIGVIRALEDEGYKIQAIAGTSIGAMIAGVYGAGFSPDEIENYLNQLDQRQFYKRRPADGPAMLGLAGVERALEDTLANTEFESLKIPIAMTAVDMNSGELLALRRGLVREAILAAIAVPGIFPPRNWQGRSLVDGGVLDPVPVALARDLAPFHPVVAVTLSPESTAWKRRPSSRLLTSLPFVSQYLSRMRIAQAVNIFFRSVDIAGTSLTDMRLSIDKPEVIVRPDTHDIGLLDQIDFSEVALLGEIATRAILPELDQVIRWPNRVSRQFRRVIPSEKWIVHHVP